MANGMSSGSRCRCGYLAALLARVHLCPGNIRLRGFISETAWCHQRPISGWKTRQTCFVTAFAQVDLAPGTCSPRNRNLSNQFGLLACVLAHGSLLVRSHIRWSPSQRLCTMLSQRFKIWLKVCMPRSMICSVEEAWQEVCQRHCGAWHSVGTGVSCSSTGRQLNTYAVSNSC